MRDSILLPDSVSNGTEAGCQQKAPGRSGPWHELGGSDFLPATTNFFRRLIHVWQSSDGNGDSGYRRDE